VRLTLKEALAQVELELGQTYHCEVNGRSVEVRVGISGHPDRELVIREADFMLEPWAEFPDPPAAFTVIPRLASPEEFLPDPPVIPTDEEPE
jgi:hypothetical protein